MKHLLSALALTGLCLSQCVAPAALAQSLPASAAQIQTANNNLDGMLISGLSPVMEWSGAEGTVGNPAPVNGVSDRTFNLTSLIHKPLKVYVESYPSDTPTYKQAYHQFVTDCLNQWSQALNGRLRYELTDSPRDAQMRFYWVTALKEPDQAGTTDYTIGDANIRIKTANLPPNIIKASVLHEIGHALGIGTHSENNNDIMKTGREWASYQEYRTYQPKLSMRDIQAIRRLYSTEWHPGEDLYDTLDRESRTAMRTP